MQAEPEGCILELREVTFKEGLDLGQTELQSIYWFVSHLSHFR
jgi:hypothetical protein